MVFEQWPDQSRSRVGPTLSGFSNSNTEFPDPTRRSVGLILDSDSGAACGTIDPVKKYISVDIGDASFVCYNNIIYYLVGASGLVDDCFGSAEDNELCDSTLAPSLKALPGLGELDGNQWGGVLKDDFIIG